MLAIPLEIIECTVQCSMLVWPGLYNIVFTAQYIKFRFICGCPYQQLITKMWFQQLPPSLSLSPSRWTCSIITTSTAVCPLIYLVTVTYCRTMCSLWTLLTLTALWCKVFLLLFSAIIFFWMRLVHQQLTVSSKSTHPCWLFQWSKLTNLQNRRHSWGLNKKFKTSLCN